MRPEGGPPRSALALMALGGAGLAVSAFMPSRVLLSHFHGLSERTYSPIELLGQSADAQLLLLPHAGGALVALALVTRAVGATRLHRALVSALMALTVAIRAAIAIAAGGLIALLTIQRELVALFLLLPLICFCGQIRPVFEGERSPLWRLARLAQVGGWWSVLPAFVNSSWGPGALVTAVSSIAIAIGGGRVTRSSIAEPTTFPCAVASRPARTAR